MRFFLGVVLFPLSLVTAPHSVSEPLGWTRLVGSFIALFVGLCFLLGIEFGKKES